MNDGAIEFFVGTILTIVVICSFVAWLVGVGQVFNRVLDCWIPVCQ